MASYRAGVPTTQLMEESGTDDPARAWSSDTSRSQRPRRSRTCSLAAAGEPLVGEAGLLKGVLKAALERGLDAELTEHVGYERGDAEAALFPELA